MLASALGAGGVWWLRRDGDAGLVTAAEPNPASGTASRVTPEPSTTTTASAPTSSSSTSTSASVPSTSSTSSTTTTTTSAPTTTTTTVVGSTAAALNGTTLEVIPRSAWGAVPAGAFISHQIDRITVHHSAVGFLDNRLGPARIRQHQNYHQSLGWPDLAYHLVIDRLGNVFEGRPFTAVGDTGTDYDPTAHFLPMCEGNFDEHDPSAAQLDALAAVVGWARAAFSTDVVAGHRDVASTTCPGDRLASQLDGVIGVSDGYLGLSLVVLSHEEGAARVAGIEA